MSGDTTFSIADLEKAIKYAKAQNAVVIQVQSDNLNSRLIIGVQESYKGSGATITVYCSESAKMPTIQREETLF